jgi:hypothetical protein
VCGNSRSFDLTRYLPALLEDSRRTQEPIAHIVSRALADYLQVPHHTLYQVSTAAGLVEGIYRGAGQAKGFSGLAPRT